AQYRGGASVAGRVLKTTTPANSAVRAAVQIDFPSVTSFWFTEQQGFRSCFVTGYTHLGRGALSTMNSKRQLANGISAFAVAAALMVATPAFGQNVTATVQGRVEGATAGTT